MKAGSLWARPRFAWLAAICVCVIAVGLVPGVKVAAATQAAGVNLAYACQFPSGAKQVRVRIYSAFPGTGTVNTPIQPDKVTVSVTVPRASLGDLTRLGAGAVTGTVQLSVLVTQPGTSVDARWPALAISSTAIPKDGDVTLAGSGPVPPATVAATGSAAFSAGDLAVALTMRRADGGATTPTAVSLACTPNLGQNTTMVTVPISGSNQPGTIGRAGIKQARAVQRADQACEHVMLPPFGFNHNILPFPGGFPPDPDPANGFIYNVPPDQVTSGCANVLGYTNVNKLGASAKLRGVIGADTSLRDDYNIPSNYVQADTIAFPSITPPPATFLSFGFVPTTARVELKPIGNTNIVAEGAANGTLPGARTSDVTAYAQVWLSISDVHVNGVPLDVGAHCRIARPMALTLTGHSNLVPNYQVDTGGELQGVANIPPFKGCGVNDNLDPLLTASVSGPGNHLSLLQGPLCIPSYPNQCPRTDFGWSVTPGGAWSATSGGPYITVNNRVDYTQIQFACQSATLKGTLRKGTHMFNRIGAITDASTMTCADQTQQLPGTFTVTYGGLPWPLDVRSYDPTISSGEAVGQFNGVSVQVSGPGCSFNAAGYGTFLHDNSPSAFAPSLQGVNVSDVSGCNGLVAAGSFLDFLFGPGAGLPFGGFDPAQTITSP
jgi:hypothetical protein